MAIEEPTKKRVLIVDGTNLFIRSYVVDPTLDINGTPIGGVAGTLKSLRAIINIISPQKVIFVWDGPGGSMQKRKLFKEYKEGRKPVVGQNYVFADEQTAKENKIWQMEKLRSLIKCLPICQIVTQNIEADDAIAYIVKSREYFDHSTNIIVTCDKDFYQLVEDKVAIYNPIKKVLLTKDDILKDTGYHPKNWLFYKSINGDASDNIKGIKGVGPKTIQKLFDVGSEEILTPEIVSEKYLACDEKDKKYKNYKMLHENIDTIKANWKLMSLHDLLISIQTKEKLTDKINNFKPILNYLQFTNETIKLGGLGLYHDYLDSFLKLKV